jgi:hypothetical protein
MWLIPYLYDLLQCWGIWQKLLAHHKQRQVANAEGDIARKSDGAVADDLHTHWQRPD